MSNNLDFIGPDCIHCDGTGYLLKPSLLSTALFCNCEAGARRCRRIPAPLTPWGKLCEETTPDETNPKDLIGDTKAPLHLVPSALTIFVSWVMALGARKYGPFNWRSKKVRRTVYLAAALRHILAALDGEDCDSESGEPHEAHAAACMGIILDASATGNLIDDRATPGAAASLLKRTSKEKVL